MTLLWRAEALITEEAVKAIAGQFREEVMTLLGGAEAVIPEGVVKAIAKWGHEGVLKTIEENFKNSHPREQWSIAQFYNAAKSGKEGTIQKLLAEGVDPDLKNSRHISLL